MSWTIRQENTLRLAQISIEFRKRKYGKNTGLNDQWRRKLSARYRGYKRYNAYGEPLGIYYNSTFEFDEKKGNMFSLILNLDSSCNKERVTRLNWKV